VIRDTYVARQPGESNNDRNDRAIRRAVSWYQNHLDQSLDRIDEVGGVKIVLLTNDSDNRVKAKAERILVYTGLCRFLCIFYIFL